MKIPRLNLFFGAILAIGSVFLVIWALGHTNYSHSFILILSCFFALFMAFNMGGNDVANSFGTSVGSKTLTIKQALLIAAVFEVSGAVIAGGSVTNTIKNGIIDLNKMALTPIDLVYVMMSGLVASAFWLLFATKKGLPVSTTHSIIGGLVGSGMTLGYFMHDPNVSAMSLVKWSEIGKIALSWVISPALGGAVAYLIFGSIKKFILDYNEIAQVRIDKLKKEKKALKKAFKAKFEKMEKIDQLTLLDDMEHDQEIVKSGYYESSDLETDYYKQIAKIDQKRERLKTHNALQVGVPISAALGTAIITTMLLTKGLKNLNLGINSFQIFLIVMMITATVWLTSYIFAKTLKGPNLSKSTFLMFSWLQVFSAAAFAFSHGSNDISNAVGPFAAILDALAHNSTISSNEHVNAVVMICFGIALVSGLWFVGKEVILTVGTHLTQMHPASGFSAELAGGAVVMAASLLGIPVSSTHILIGAVLGVGLINKNTNWALMKPIAAAWVITLPASALISSLAFIILRLTF